MPAHLRRERVVIPAPSVCLCCQGKLVKPSEDVTETLEVIPGQLKVIQTVREKFSCRSAQPPAPIPSRDRVSNRHLPCVRVHDAGLGGACVAPLFLCPLGSCAMSMSHERSPRCNIRELPFPCSAKYLIYPMQHVFYYI